MSNFPGFPPGKIHHTRIPDLFFSELMPAMDSLAELKVILYAFWFVEQQEETTRFITFDDFSSDSLLMEGLGNEPEAALSEALEKATQRGFFLKAHEKGSANSKSIFFINTPRGRAAVQAIRNGQWKPGTDIQVPTRLKVERPNIFRLYEENIGPLTPLIAEKLNSAAEEYPDSWIEEAFTIAVQKNARNWRYIEAILKGWKEKGKNGTDRQDLPENRRRYIEGEYGDLIEH